MANVPFETVEEIGKERDAEAKLEVEKEHRDFEKIKIRLVATKAVGVLVAAVAIVAGLYLAVNQGNWYGFALGIFMIIVGIVIAAIVSEAGSSNWRPKRLWLKAPGP